MRETNDRRDDTRDDAAPSAGTTATGAATGAVAGAAAGLAAGLGTIAAGPLGMVFGARVGAAIGQAGAQGTAEAIYTSAYDEHYRAVWEGTPGRTADTTFEMARPAYQLGHLAAAQPEYAGRDFLSAEPDLRRIWERDFASQYGSWESARRYVSDGYGHARAEGLGFRRDYSVIGTGGSAVDPVELARARAGLASRADTPERDEPLYPTELTATTETAVPASREPRLAEGAEVPANQAEADRLRVR
jgi:hypothetical protein